MPYVLIKRNKFATNVYCSRNNGHLYKQRYITRITLVIARDIFSCLSQQTSRYAQLNRIFVTILGEKWLRLVNANDGTLLIEEDTSWAWDQPEQKDEKCLFDYVPLPRPPFLKEV